MRKRRPFLQNINPRVQKASFTIGKKPFTFFLFFYFFFEEPTEILSHLLFLFLLFFFLSATGPEDCTVDVFKTVAPSPSDLMRPNEVPSESDGVFYVKMYPDVNVYQSCNK